MTRSSTSWDTFRPVRPLQPLWVALGLLTLLPGLAGTYLRLLAPTDDTQATFASFASYAVLAYALATVFFLVAFLRARSRAVLGVLTLVAVALASCHAYWLAPLFVPDDRPARTPTFALLSLNLLHGSANPDDVYALGQRADVVVLLEATPPALDALERRGWQQRFGYSVGVVNGVNGDTILYSRFPLSDQAQLPRSAFQQWTATADVPQIGPVRIIAAHPCNPYCGGNQFAVDHAALNAVAMRYASAPLVVAGDLNATYDHAPIRHLDRAGIVSVTDLVGAGWLPTFPANRTIPPLLPIDHVLLSRQLTATSVTRLPVRDTDHLALLTDIAGAT
jgi:endonuclease/exonuclease/phosphatase (EEP) superfamily protein YafD